MSAGRRKLLLRSILVTAALGSWAGCMHPARNDPARVGPFFTPANYSGDPSVRGIRRVVVLPIWVGEGTPPESAAALDDIFVTALQREKRFEVVRFSREEFRRRFHADAVSSTANLPHDLFSVLQRDSAADAVLFIDLTAFNAYKPLTMGLRGKLAAVDGSRFIWSFDNVFASAAPAVANSARHHFLDRDKEIPTDRSGAVLQSPARFAEYAAASMFATLPPVIPTPVIISK